VEGDAKLLEAITAVVEGAIASQLESLLLPRIVQHLEAHQSGMAIVHRLEARKASSMPSGMAGMPSGMAGMPSGMAVHAGHGTTAALPPPTSATDALPPTKLDGGPFSDEAIGGHWSVPPSAALAGIGLTDGTRNFAARQRRIADRRAASQGSYDALPVAGHAPSPHDDDGVPQAVTAAELMGAAPAPASAVQVSLRV